MATLVRKKFLWFCEYFNTCKQYHNMQKNELIFNICENHEALNYFRLLRQDEPDYDSLWKTHQQMVWSPHITPQIVLHLDFLT